MEHKVANTNVLHDTAMIGKKVVLIMMHYHCNASSEVTSLQRSPDTGCPGTHGQEGQQNIDVTGDVGRDVRLARDLGAETLQNGWVVQLLVEGHLL